MITLAFDTATDRCTVAATNGGRNSHRFVDGARSHAGAIIGLIDGVLGELGAVAADVDAIVMADGPGSFTGLRVAAAVAKAMTWRREITWRVAPSLLVRAAAHAPPQGGVVLALSDALRGDVYAGCWHIGPGAVAVRQAPRAVAPDLLASFGPVDVVVGSIPDALMNAVRSATGREPVCGTEALPDARTLLGLANRTDATFLVTDPATWQPDYGRPAEAQAKWERAHGRKLPAATGIPR
jgi:tRNA threonylcarbamoyladenosine biosynthesis protein TsaB